MKKYVVIFSVKPAVRLDPKLDNVRLNFYEQESLKQVIISKIEQRVSQDSKIQLGLRFRVFLYAKDLEEAREEAKNLVDALASFITLVTGVGLSIPCEELIYEVTPKVQERKFVQVFHDPITIHMSRRILNCELLFNLVDRSLKLKPNYHRRVGRAIRWYRMGIMTFDKFDRFNCFWIGLEALNPLLQEKLSVKDDPIKCPKCGYKWIVMPTVSGIRTFVQHKLFNEKDLYKRIYQLRINIMHAKHELGKLGSEVSELLPKTGEILFLAICYLLGVNGWHIIAYKNILERVPTRLELHGTLIGGEPESLGPEGRAPYFEPKRPVLHWKVSIDGSPSFTAEFNFVACLNPDVQWRKREVRLYGDAEINASIKTEVHKKEEKIGIRKRSNKNRDQRIQDSTV